MSDQMAKLFNRAFRKILANERNSDEASSQNSKIETMREMGRLAFDEMRNFLITNERSRFVM